MMPSAAASSSSTMSTPTPSRNIDGGRHDVRIRSSLVTVRSRTTSVPPRAGPKYLPRFHSTATRKRRFPTWWKPPPGSRRSRAMASLRVGAGPYGATFAFFTVAVASAVMNNHVAAENVTPQAASKRVYVAGLFDTSHLKWGPEIFNFAVDLINDHNDGWFDDVLDDGTELLATIADSGCDPRVSLPAYWNLRTKWGAPLHGVVGCRCSGATAAVARVAGLEWVPVVSPVSSAAPLSDSAEFPSLHRLVGPDDERGQVGALVNLLRKMGWDRVTVLNTNTKYTRDLATAFGNAWVGHHEANEEAGTPAWTGEVAYSHTISLVHAEDADDEDEEKEGSYVDEASVRRALDGVPTDDPRQNSRVILLLAHHHHAYPILEMAQDIAFQPDTIWIGTAAWSDRFPPDGDLSRMPKVPGFLGLVPYRNRDDRYRDFLERLQASQSARGLSVMDDLPDYSAEMLVDSILALVMALSKVSPELRGDGQAVLSALQNVTFSGLSGPVSFTAEGDRADPHYSVMNWQNGDKNKWTEVGQVGTRLGSANIRLEDICWAVFGCGLAMAPRDKPPVPPAILPPWIWAIISIFAVTVLVGVYLFIRLRRSKQKIKVYFEQHQEVADAKRKIETEIERKEDEVEELNQRLAYLIQQPMDPQDRPSTWTPDSTGILVEVNPTDLEYWTVSDKLRETMDDAWISHLYRIQNYPQWIYFNFHKERLRNSGVNDEDIQVWHGTRTNNPAQIYNDIQDGFLMQFAQQGLWGRGLYFAEKSCYSDDYAFQPYHAMQEEPQLTGHQEAPMEDEREMFLTRLLVGRGTFIERPRPDLKVPPVDPASSQRFNSVWSFARGLNGVFSRVWVVYENGRAYPEYLVRYYRGNRDPQRTPTMEESIV